MSDCNLNLPKAVAILTVLLGLLAVAPAAETPLPPTLIIHTAGGYPLPGATNDGPQVIAALWSDGKVVWSESVTNGGPVYKQGQFEAAKLVAILNSLEGKGAFTNAALARARFGPDARFTTIAINDGRRQLRLQSWHELYEQNTNVVATAAGLTSLGGKKREDVLQQQPEDYRQFRSTWLEIRDAVAALIPQNGTTFEGQILIPRK